jgi:hypothetical protein
MRARGRAKERFSPERPRCEIYRTLRGVHCREPGIVEFMGVTLCRTHARELMAERLENLWLSILYQLDAWLEGSGVGKEGDLAERVRGQREHAARGLDLARKDLCG